MPKKISKVSKQLEKFAPNAVYVSVFLDGKSIKLPGFYTLNEFDIVQPFNPNRPSITGMDLSYGFDEDPLLDTDNSLNNIDPYDDADEK